MERLRTPLLALLIFSLTGILYWIWSDLPKSGSGLLPLPRGLENTLLAQPQPLPPVRLTTAEGHPFGQEQLHGKWTFLFFGYTHCPDICPTTLLTLQQVRKHLSETPAYLTNAQFVFVTLDPQRDTAEVLRQYVNYFDPSFIAASGDTAAIDSLTTALGTPYAIEDGADPDSYVVNHTASILLIDPQARYYARFATTTEAIALGDAFRRARDFYYR